MLLGTASQSLLQLGVLFSVVSWLGQELFDLLTAENPARLSLEAQSERVGMGAGITASQNLQLPVEFGSVHWPDPAMGFRSRTAWASAIERQIAPKPPSCCTSCRKARCSGLTVPEPVLISRATNWAMR